MNSYCTKVDAKQQQSKGLPYGLPAQDLSLTKHIEHLLCNSAKKLYNQFITKTTMRDKIKEWEEIEESMHVAFMSNVNQLN